VSIVGHTLVNKYRLSRGLIAPSVGVEQALACFIKPTLSVLKPREGLARLYIVPHLFHKLKAYARINRISSHSAPCAE
jgi:hypothetical protein